MATPDESSSRMDPYDILEQIGKGAFGAAWIIQTRGTDSAPPRRYVLKKIPLARLSERQRQLSIQERQLVAALRHPYVVPYHRSWIEKSHTICIVMRHCDGGDLASLTWRAKRRNERFPESQLQLWLAQLLSALAYLHGKRVIHRDVKPGNVFLTSDGDVRLGDFGLARVNDASVKDDNQASSAVGTPHFMSPEILKGDKYGFAADVWSLGCVAYELTTLRQPFTAFNMDGLKRKILTSQPAGFNRPGKEGEEDALLYGEGWRSIVRSMLRKAPEDRPSANELLSGQYMSAAAESAIARAREIEAAESMLELSGSAKEAQALKRLREGAAALATMPPLPATAAEAATQAKAISVPGTPAPRTRTHLHPCPHSAPHARPHPRLLSQVGKICGGLRGLDAAERAAELSKRMAEACPIASELEHTIVSGVTKALGHLLVHYYFCVYCFTTGDYCGHCSSYNQFQRVAPGGQSGNLGRYAQKGKPAG